MENDMHHRSFVLCFAATKGCRIGKWTGQNATHGLDELGKVSLCKISLIRNPIYDCQ